MKFAKIDIQNTSGVSLEKAKIFRGPFQMLVNLTNQCNFKCLHCYNESGNNFIFAKEISDEEFIELAKDLAKLRLYGVSLGGGEPLFRKDLMYKMAKILVASGARLSFESNGSLITAKVARELLASGISYAQISLHGAKADTHEKLTGIVGSFDKAVRAIKLLKTLGFKRIDVAFCPTSFNYMELEATVKLCRTLGVKKFRITQIVSDGRAREYLAALLPSFAQYREMAKVVASLRNEREPGLVIEWVDQIGDIVRFSSARGHNNEYTCVRADGAIEIAGVLPIVVGNIRKHKFSEYWEAGLGRIWEVKEVNKLAQRVSSISSEGSLEIGEKSAWAEREINLDIIDENLIPKEPI